MVVPNRRHRIIARDRRMAAVHEAGHAVVAMHLGAQVQSVHIRASRTKDLRSEKSYVGQATYEQPPCAEQVRLIAVAGMVAEGVWKASGVTHRCWWEEMFDPACMSDTDWAGTGCEPGNPDDRLHLAAERVEELLSGLLWPALLSLSRKLIEAESRRTEEAVMSVFAAIGYRVSAA